MGSNGSFCLHGIGSFVSKWVCLFVLNWIHENLLSNALARLYEIECVTLYIYIYVWMKNNHIYLKFNFVMLTHRKKKTFIFTSFGELWLHQGSIPLIARNKGLQMEPTIACIIHFMVKFDTCSCPFTHLLRCNLLSEQILLSPHPEKDMSTCMLSSVRHNQQNRPN